MIRGNPEIDRHPNPETERERKKGSEGGWFVQLIGGKMWKMTGNEKQWWVSDPTNMHNSTMPPWVLPSSKQISS
jgi:hypothetical protein